MRTLLGMLSFVVALGTASRAVATPKEAVLHFFPGGQKGGAPYAGLLFGPGGSLYGTTTAIGSRALNADGNVFRLKPELNGKQWVYASIHAFDIKKGDGGRPYGGLVADTNGALYGTTTEGGAANGGIAYELTPPAKGKVEWNEAILYSFPANSSPTSTLLFGSHASLIGTTLNSGNRFGAVFQLLPPAAGHVKWSEADLYDFNGGTDGSNPYAGVISDAGGALYGTTLHGGGSAACPDGCGIVYKLTPPQTGQTAWIESVLYSFKGSADGANPYGGLVFDQVGNLYGTAAGGGDANGDGVVFKLSPPAGGSGTWAETVIHTMNLAVDGAAPEGNLIFDSSGNLFGTTFAGGPAGYYGGVFKLAPVNGGATWTYSVLYSFPAGTANGCAPVAGVVESSKDDLFGTASTCGPGLHSAGAVYEIQQ